MLVDVKIQCPCGARYKFDVEPSHGRMPAPVHCPVCGVEGTASANAIIQQKLAPPPPAPTAEVEIIPPPQRAAHNSALAVAAASTASTLAQSGRRATPLPREPLPVKRPAQLVPGTVGAIIAAAIGGTIWFSLIALTGFELGLIAWGAGALIGWAARTLARSGSARLGWLAAACAFTALGLASCLAAWRISGFAPPGTILAQAFGGATAIWLLLAAASAGRLASR